MTACICLWADIELRRLRCDLHSGHRIFSFVLPMENTRTMYCSAWLYGDPDYVDTLRQSP